jgi:hypothetical protein
MFSLICGLQMFHSYFLSIFSLSLSEWSNSSTLY